MKLELKHYLDAFKYNHPVRLSKQGLFNLDLEHPDDRFNGVGFIKYISILDDDISGEIRIGNTGADFDFDINDDSDLELILRPLSDLTTEEMEVIRNIMFPNAKQWTKQHWNFIKTVKSFPLLQSYYVVEYLKSIHVDIFGLIENNLAININDLK